MGVWGEKNVIVEGHGRVLAAKKLGLTEIPCIRLDHLSDEERRAYALAHNRTAELSEWDFDVQALELEEITDIDMSLFGFDFESEEPSEIFEDDFEPTVPEEPRAKVGDLFALGNHRLMCGDSTKREDVMKLMGGAESTDRFYRPALECKLRPGKREVETAQHPQRQYEHRGFSGIYEFRVRVHE